MEFQWFRQDKPAVLDALRRGQRPLMATTMASGPLDELVALHIELGLFEALDAVPVTRQRDGIADPLLLRTLATLPFLPEAGLDPAAGLLFQEPALLLHLGWAPAQIQSGDNRRHRHPEGRQARSLPCHPDTLRDELRRVEAAAWLKAQKAGVAALYDRQFVRGRVYAIDGSGRRGRFPPGLPGLRLGAAASDRGLAAAGGGGLREGPRGGGHPRADRAGAGAGRARLHRA